MDYERAVALARTGVKVFRPHWHWVYLSASEKATDKLALFDEGDGHERGVYRPTRPDRTATDWGTMP